MQGACPSGKGVAAQAAVPSGDGHYDASWVVLAEDVCVDVCAPVGAAQDGTSIYLLCHSALLS